MSEPRTEAGKRLWDRVRIHNIAQRVRADDRHDARWFTEITAIEDEAAAGVAPRAAPSPDLAALRVARPDIEAFRFVAERFGERRVSVGGATVDLSAAVLVMADYIASIESAPPPAKPDAERLDVELAEARATIGAMSGDAADLTDLMDEAAALRTALAHVLVRTHDTGCGTCDAARALLAAEHELPSFAARLVAPTATEPGDE